MQKAGCPPEGRGLFSVQLLDTSLIEGQVVLQNGGILDSFTASFCKSDKQGWLPSRVWGLFFFVQFLYTSDRRRQVALLDGGMGSLFFTASRYKSYREGKLSSRMRACLISEQLLFSRQIDKAGCSPEGGVFLLYTASIYK